MDGQDGVALARVPVVSEHDYDDFRMHRVGLLWAGDLLLSEHGYDDFRMDRMGLLGAGDLLLSEYDYDDSEMHGIGPADVPSLAAGSCLRNPGHRLIRKIVFGRPPHPAPSGIRCRS